MGAREAIMVATMGITALSAETGCAGPYRQVDGLSAYEVRTQYETPPEGGFKGPACLEGENPDTRKCEWKTIKQVRELGQKIGELPPEDNSVAVLQKEITALREIALRCSEDGDLDDCTPEEIAKARKLADTLADHDEEQARIHGPSTPLWDISLGTGFSLTGSGKITVNSRINAHRGIISLVPQDRWQLRAGWTAGVTYGDLAVVNDDFFALHYAPERNRDDAEQSSFFTGPMVGLKADLNKWVSVTVDGGVVYEGTKANIITVGLNDGSYYARILNTGALTPRAETLIHFNPLAGLDITNGLRFSLGVAVNTKPTAKVSTNGKNLLEKGREIDLGPIITAGATF